MMEQPRTAVGSRVLVPHKNIQGTVSYIGELRGRIGQWVGLTLDSPIGLNNGSVDNIEYFKCADKCGLFLRPDKIQINQIDTLAARVDRIETRLGEVDAQLQTQRPNRTPSPRVKKDIVEFLRGLLNDAAKYNEFIQWVGQDTFVILNKPEIGILYGTVYGQNALTWKTFQNKICEAASIQRNRNGSYTFQ